MDGRAHLTVVDAPAADADGASDPDVAVRRPRRRPPGWIVAGLVVVLVVCVQWLVVEPATVRGDSMAPTLRPGEHLAIDKLTYRFRAPRVGELVIAHDPSGGGTIVKRVVAVGGDSVGIEDGALVRNGHPVVESYTDKDGMDGYFHGPVSVRSGFVFLLGDNRATSVDSRSFGPVSINAIEGRVVAQLWPPRSLTG